MYNFFFKIFRKTKYKIRSNYRAYNIFNFLNHKSIFIDIGGNMGTVSQYVLDVYNPKLIEIYEPHNLLYLNLKKRFKNYRNVNIYNNAVSNSNSQGFLYLRNKDDKDLSLLAGSSLEKNKKNINKLHSQKIELIHIEEIILKFKYIDCIKIDIEGHEYKILDYLIKNKNKIGKLVCEFHGTDEDIAINKNHEFRKNFLKYKDIIYKLQEDEWLITWH